MTSRLNVPTWVQLATPAILAGFIMAPGAGEAQQRFAEFQPASETETVRFKTIEVDGLEVFYREAGQPGMPKLVLLHGFPGSSAYYRHLIPALADRFHIVAPDYPGFGNSAKPDPAVYGYTFDKASETIEGFLDAIGFHSFGLFMQDYGGPVGFRIVGRRPEMMEWLIIQNTNAYEVGFAEVWDGLRGAYWLNPTPETEKPLEGFLAPETVKTLYQHGHPDPSLVSPDSWQNDIAHLGHRFATRINLDLFYDYRTNVPLYAEWQRFMREEQPETQIFWGKGDIFFTPEGGEAYLADLPNAEYHVLDSGHFAVEDSYLYIAEHMKRFYSERVDAR
jgi:pimeloyl-ACP methyl ester carboxylesterase